MNKKSRKYLVKGSFMVILFISLLAFSTTVLAEKVEFSFNPEMVDFEGEVEIEFI